MTSSATPAAPAAPVVEAGTGRRAHVLRVALATFARFGYRRTSMDQVARDAGISRPGLYFLFASKEALFREAVTRSLTDDLAAAEAALRTDASLRDRVLAGFDAWAGRYVGPLTRDVAAVIDDNPGLLGPIGEAAPRRFAELVTAALAGQHDATTAQRIAQTLISTSVGIKHQVADRPAYRERLEVAVDLLLTSPQTAVGSRSERGSARA